MEENIEKISSITPLPASSKKYISLCFFSADANKHTSNNFSFCQKTLIRLIPQTFRNI